MASPVSRWQRRAARGEPLFWRLELPSRRAPLPSRLWTRHRGWDARRLHRQGEWL